MSAELEIDYFTPEFNQFRQDVLQENLFGVVVTQLPYGPRMAEDFRHGGVPESKIDSADIIIRIIQSGRPAMVLGKSPAGKMFLKTRKYACMR